MRLLRFFCWSGLAAFCALVLSFSGAFLYLSPSLPSVESLRSIQLQIPLRVYSSDAKQIGEFVMDGLKALDSVAYIRFASVYKDFSEAKDFEDFAGSVVEAAQK